MFCSKCGAELLQESKVCSNCGAPVEQEEDNGFQVDLTQAVTPEAPVQPVEKGRMLSKSKFISQLAPKRVKVFSIIVVVLTFLMIASIAFSAYTAVNTSLERTPIGTAAFVATGADLDEFDEIKEEAVTGVEDAEEYLEKYEDEFDAEEIEILNETIDILKDCEENLSIKNIHKIIKNIAEIQKFPIASELEMDEIIGGGADIAMEVLYSIYYVVLGCFAFALIFSIFGGFFKRTGLIITGMIFAILFSLIFSGVVATLLVTLVHSLLIGFTAAVNGSYKEYRRSF